jgi:hypothetical protein
MKLSLTIALFLILGIALLQAPAFAEDFSADVITKAPTASMAAKMYISGNKSRMESAGTITISRMDKKVVWILMPNEKMYMEQPLDPRTAATTQTKVNGEIERRAEGNEVINGMKTTKYRVTIQNQGKRESMFQWVDEGMHFPIKTAAIDGSWSTEFRNIRRGAQNPQLFEIPAGYTKMSMGMPNMGAIMNSMGGAGRGRD